MSSSQCRAFLVAAQLLWDSFPLESRQASSLLPLIEDKLKWSCFSRLSMGDSILFF